MDSVQSDVILQSTFQDTAIAAFCLLRLAWRASGVRHTRLDAYYTRSGGYLWINDSPCAQTNATQRWG